MRDLERNKFVTEAQNNAVLYFFGGASLVKRPDLVKSFMNNVKYIAR